jgi:isochorismate hydrolase
MIWIFRKTKNSCVKSGALAKRIAALKQRCKKAGIPTIYVNDNKGKWRSDFSEVVRRCLRRNAPGRAMVKRLIPASADYIVLKPKHS